MSIHDPARPDGRDARRRAWLEPLPRRPELSRRGLVLSVAARSLDELLYGAFATLTPTIARTLGLSVAQIGLAVQVVATTGAAVEPVTGAAADVARRRHLLAFGAAAWALAVAAIGAANALPTLLFGAVLIGLGSGPLAHTGDAVFIEGHPDAVDRISARAAVIDWCGALAGPLVVAATVALAPGAWRWTLAALALVAATYALVALRTPLPDSTGRDHDSDDGLSRQLLRNAGTALRDRRARLWILFLVVEDLTEAGFALVPLWLAREVGLSQASVGVVMALFMAGGLLGTVATEPLVARFPARRVLLWSVACAGIAHLAWVVLGTPWVAFVLAPVVGAVAAPLWPVARGRALASVPGLAGTVSGLVALSAWVPSIALVALLADRIGLVAAIAATHAIATVALLAIGSRAASDPEPTPAAS